MLRIIGGPFAGHEGELVAEIGDFIELSIELFGRVTTVRARRADVEIEEDPRVRLRADVSADQARLRARERADHWRALVDTPEAAALDEYARYQAHCEVVDRAGRAREQALLDGFDARFGPLEAAEVRATFESERARWLVEAVTREALRASWRADHATFEQYSERGERADHRRRRAAQATDERDYQRWRSDRWSDASHWRASAEAKRALATIGPRFAQTLDEVWGFALPEALSRFWLFLRSLLPAERAAFQGLELAAFGIMDVFDRPDAEPRPGFDLRIHGRFYRDPPEMLTFMHGGTDGLHYGLFFDDGRTSSGVVSYYNNDGIELGPPHGTPLAAVRARLEQVAAQLDSDGAGSVRSFELRLLREAIMRIETGDRPERGGAYDEAYGRGAAQASATGRHPTLDGAGAWIEGAVEAPRGVSSPLTEAERDAASSRLDCIRADDPIVGQWIGEAHQRLAAGDPCDALCLGRDIHWLGAGEPGRERHACELLVAAYRAIGRDALATIAEIHHRHRNISGVNVLLVR